MNNLCCKLTVKLKNLTLPEASRRPDNVLRMKLGHSRTEEILKGEFRHAIEEVETPFSGS